MEGGDKREEGKNWRVGTLPRFANRYLIATVPYTKTCDKAHAGENGAERFGREREGWGAGQSQLCSGCQDLKRTCCGPRITEKTGVSSQSKLILSTKPKLRLETLSRTDKRKLHACFS